MAKATAIHKTAFPDIVLELEPTEARALVEYLGIHSCGSSINTYPIFLALTRALDGYPSPLRSCEILERVILTESRLVEILED